MNKQKVLITAVSLGMALLSGYAMAAKSGKGGFFIGLEGDYDSLKYTHIVSRAATNSTVAQDPAFAPYTSTGKNYSGYLVFGQRFYLNDKIGFGIKGWGGYSNAYDTTSKYQANVNNPTNIGTFQIKANAIVVGVEAQMYIDFLTIKSGAIGLTLGGGYEITQFSNVSAYTYYSSTAQYYTEIEDYSDNSWVADAGLHYQLGARNRFEVGYKLKNYEKTASYIRALGDNFRTVGFNVQNAIYANYTFSF